MRFGLTLFYAKNGREVVEVGYKYGGIEPETYGLHSSAQVCAIMPFWVGPDEGGVLQSAGRTAICR